MNKYTSTILTLICITGLTTVLTPTPVEASPDAVMSLDAVSVKNGNYPRVNVNPGAGLTINLGELNESISSLWLDDPSKLVLDYTGNLCASTCNGGAKVVHLKRVTGLDFENLPSTATTTLTIVTTSNDVYKIRLGYQPTSVLTVNLTKRPPERQLPPLFDEFTTVSADSIDSDRIALMKNGLEKAKVRFPQTSKNKKLFTRFALFINDLELGYAENPSRQKRGISADAVDVILELAK